MTDLSILCLHNSTTSWESQQRGGIVEDVMNSGEVGWRGCCGVGWLVWCGVDWRVSGVGGIGMGAGGYDGEKGRRVGGGRFIKKRT